MKSAPIYKGIITGVAMIGLTLFFFYSKIASDSGYQYLVYLLYAAGIIWTLLAYARSPHYTGKFANIFGQGFRCFIIITLLMTIFAAVFSLSHPEFAEQDAKSYREYLEKEEKSKTPAEKDEMVENLKKHYTTGLIYSAIFGHLILGALITAVGAGIILAIRKT
ncbi:MAG: DUF4199 domain-containing protein [Chitinophagaceae bacterium]